MITRDSLFRSVFKKTGILFLFCSISLLLQLKKVNRKCGDHRRWNSGDHFTLICVLRTFLVVSHVLACSVCSLRPADEQRKSLTGCVWSGHLQAHRIRRRLRRFNHLHDEPPCLHTDWWEQLMKLCCETSNRMIFTIFIFSSSVMNLLVDLWGSSLCHVFGFFFARSQIWNCVLCLCVSDTVCSSSCAAGFIVLCITFQQRGPSCYDFVSLLGDIFSFLFFFSLVFFFAGSLSQNSNETNQKRQQTECWSLSQQLHTAHSCHADFRNHCFTPSLWIHIYTFFFYFFLSCSRPKQTTNNFFHTLSSTAAS